MRLKIEKHPTENKGRITVVADSDDEKVKLDLLFQALMTTARKQGEMTSTNSFSVLFETSPEWKNPEGGRRP